MLCGKNKRMWPALALARLLERNVIRLVKGRGIRSNQAHRSKICRKLVFNHLPECPRPRLPGQREVPARPLGIVSAGAGSSGSQISVFQLDSSCEVRAGRFGEYAPRAMVHLVSSRRSVKIENSVLDHSSLTLSCEAVAHRHADQRHRLHYLRSGVRIVRVFVGRNENARTARAHLVHLEGVNRMPFIMDLGCS